MLLEVMPSLNINQQYGNLANIFFTLYFDSHNISQQDFVPRKVYCVSNLTFHAESKYAIKIFSSPTGFVQWHFLLLIFQNLSYFLQ
jgi:hypothetical protein